MSLLSFIAKSSLQLPLSKSLCACLAHIYGMLGNAQKAIQKQTKHTNSHSLSIVLTFENFAENLILKYGECSKWHELSGIGINLEKAVE